MQFRLTCIKSQSTYTFYNRLKYWSQEACHAIAQSN